MMHEGSGPAPRLVVGIGASAGGLEAFRALLSALPDRTGMAFVLVQHLDPTHASMLVGLLSSHTDMAVLEADQGLRLKVDTIHVIRPDTALSIRDGKIELGRPILERGVRLPIDHLFRSLAREYGARSAGIVLSGAGSDGSSGVRHIKAAGGLAIVQDPSSSNQSGMPQSAIDTGVVDLVLEIEAIPAALERFASLPPRVRLEPAVDDNEGSPERLSSLDIHRLGRLAALLQAQLSFDIRVYKPATIERRVLRRMSLAGFDALEAYFDHLREDSAEQQTLVRDLLISVTDFFRDREAFRALRELVIDPLVAQASPGTTLRAWIPGCATGEEAYSIGMGFLDAIEAHGKRMSAQLFATDVDRDALAFGRAAIYPASIAEHVGEHRLRAYFEPLDGKGYRVRAPLRDMVSFAPHDLTKDPPFSRMHLVSCRNVLIYLTSETQKHVLEISHFALEPNGHLFLGTAESAGPHKDLFCTVSKSHRIYGKIGASPPIAVARSRSCLLENGKEDGLVSRPATGRRVGPRRTADGDPARRAVFDACVPPTIVISEDGALLFSHGELGPYLRIPEGDRPRLELGSVLRPEIATRTRGALYRCRKNKEPVVALSSPDREERGRVRITARPALGLGDDTVIVTFEDVEQDVGDAPSPQLESPAQDAVIEQLEKELQATREDLHNTVEELETSNEELRSSNEESMSMNEELQSANEELEATTEELRSLNEELTTVNAQLREKVDDLEQANDDLHNFFASTKIATIFLDERFCIKRFTPAARELLGIDGADTGRSIGNIARELLQHDLEREAKTVLERLSTCSRELRTRDGRWITRQVLPYRTGSRRIEGIVVTFVDVTELKTVTERLAVRERQQAVTSSMGLRALRETNLQDFLDQVVRDAQQTLHTDYCEILELQPGGRRLLLRAGTGWKPGLVGAADVSAGADDRAGYTLRSSDPVMFEDLAEEMRFSGSRLLVEHEVASGFSCAIRDGVHCYGIIGAHSRRHRSFGPEETIFLQAVASVVASAISRHQTRLRLAVELGVAQVLREAVDEDAALRGSLECFSRELRTSVGEVWWPTDGGGLSRRLLQTAPPGDQERVEKRLARCRFDSDVGLVGRVFRERRAAWFTDRGDPALFERREETEPLGLVSGFGFPILSGSDVLGVVTVFSADRLVADSVFLRSLEGIGRSLGDFLVRSEFAARARRLAAITESSHDAILSYDMDGRIVEWLPGAERLFGRTAGEMIGSSIEGIVPEELRGELWAINARIREGEVVEPFETSRIRKDGTRVEVSVRSSPVRDRNGRVVGISSTDRDVTQQKETERRLVDADRQKDEFLAMLGHELRNPLAAIRSAAVLVEPACGDDPRLRRIQTVLERQTTHMSKLLDGLLDVSRIIRGKITLEPEVVDLVEICREVISDTAERMSGRTLDVRTDVPPGPLWVEADRVRLAQIVDNLLSNAVKYTGEGGSIVVALSRDDGMAALEVRDTGVGIAPELLPHIFDVFWQSQQSLDRSHGGLGLGLALVKSLTELHGGSVEASSDGEDRGSKFVIRLPIMSEAPSRPRRASKTSTSPFRILIIEDNEDVGEMLRQVLELTGHRVVVARRGREGIAMAREEEPDVVVCDLGLPDDVSGFDVARELRSDPDLKGTRLVALSGYGRPEDKARSAEVGFDAHLTKPVDMRTLERILVELGSPGAARRS